MSRQASLKELFTSSWSLPEVENDDDFGELTPERQENDLDSNFGPADPDHMSLTQMSGQESPFSEFVDEATATSAGTEIKSEIISQPNQPHCEKFPSKKLVNSNVVLILNGLMTNGCFGFTGMTSQKAFGYIYRNIFRMHQLTLSKNAEDAFIYTGFDNWKRATTAFEQH